MSVTVAVTVTLPNTTAALLAATSTDFNLTVGPEIIRLVKAQVGGNNTDSQLAGATVATVVT